ncbi:MAG: DsrE family protein [Flavobacteriaceae bacterium]
MKHLLLIAFAFLSLSGFKKAEAQNTTQEEKQNYVVLTRQIPQLKPIIFAAQDLAEEDGANFGEYHVVVCGKTIEGITDHQKMNEYLTLAKKHNVKLFACGFSMQKFGVEPSQLPKGVDVVKNGILYNFQLQKKGFKSITL